jgi:hypothetical protein
MSDDVLPRRAHSSDAGPRAVAVLTCRPQHPRGTDTGPGRHLLSEWGPTPPMRSGVILVTNFGGGSGILGKTTSGRGTHASRCRSSAAPHSVTRAVPYMTRSSRRPHSLVPVDDTESAMRGSRRRFRNFC